jgi:hypothetical protein
MTNQLERDIEARVNERLRVWIKDSIELYRMAGLNAKSYPVIAYALVQAAIVAMFMANGLDRDEAYGLLKEITDVAYDKPSRRR